MRDDDVDSRPVAADPVDLLDDGEIHVGLLTEVLEHVRQHDLVDRIVRPRPGKYLEIDDPVGLQAATLSTFSHPGILILPQPRLRRIAILYGGKIVLK